MDTLKNRDKRMYCFNKNDMEMYTANYANTNHNFVIQNNKGSIKKDDKWFPLICVIKNILMRGAPTLMSKYLKEEIGEINLYKRVPLIDNETPIWLNTIKGFEEKDDYPAKIFFEKVIPEYLPEYKYIQQLLLPEANITDITLSTGDQYIGEQVDFYLPQAKMIVEIDGVQHSKDVGVKNRDNERNKTFSSEKFGIETIRIKSSEIKNSGVELQKKIKKIEKRLIEYDKYLAPYKAVYVDREIYPRNEKTLLATAILRFQITLLSLLEKGKISFDDKEWQLSVIKKDIYSDKFAILAVNDLLIWFENLASLANIELVKPEIKINILGEYQTSDFLTIDFSIMKRWTDENKLHPEIVYVRTDYYDDYNYFKVSTADELIDYKIDPNGKSKVLEFFVSNIFNHDNFLPGQKNIIVSVLNGNDTIGLLPTGSGKSLVYQLSGLLQPCVTIIIVPIKSLMLDQRTNLDKIGISNTDFINSDIDGGRKSDIQNAFADAKYQFVWIAPERLQTIDFRNRLKVIGEKYLIGLTVVDEVHCLSEWGHDFRTSYLGLSNNIRKFCKEATVLALTATASAFALKDIVSEFDIERKNIKTLPIFKRPELVFEVIEDKKGDKKENILLDLVKKLTKENALLMDEEHTTDCGIVFTLLKSGSNGCYSLSRKIKNKLEIDARWYSGTCPVNDKKNIMNNDEFNDYKISTQNEYKENRFPLIVATKAFGMGIDKPNIKYTIHYGMPSSVEAFYQEAGRAGRGKKFKTGAEKAFNYIIFSPELMPEDEILKKLNGQKVSVQEIRTLMDTIKYPKDAFQNLYFWQMNSEDVEDEVKIIMEFVKNYVKPGKKGMLSKISIQSINPLKRIKLTKQQIEKIIYKLSLLEIVDGWLIKDWNPEAPIIYVKYNEFDKKTLLNALGRYLRKYSEESEVVDFFNSKEVKSYYENESLNQLEAVEFPLKKLLSWQFDNIIYNRRKSIGTLYEWCLEYENDPEKFKEKIEGYFSLDDNIAVLDYLVDNPMDTRVWSEIFLTKGKLADMKDLRIRRAALTRFLESYRNNTALNFINALFAGIFEELERKEHTERLYDALKRMRRLNDEAIIEAIKGVKVLSTCFSDKTKVILAKALIAEFPDKVVYICDALNDEYSLRLLLNDYSSRIREKLGGLFDGYK